MHTAFSMRRLRGLVLVALAALLAIGVLLTANGQARSHHTGVKPTIVLVHGAWADASSWNGEIARLHADGYPVIAPANPLRSLSGDAAYIASVLKTIKGPIVLVGHSYGGAVITNAATGNPNVKALVYIDAFVPAQGETVLGLAGMNPGSQLPASITEAPYDQGAGQSGVDIYIKAVDFRSAFAGDVSPATADLMAVTQRPVTLAALSEPSGIPAWTNMPSWYLVGRQDQAIPEATQLFMARRAHSHIVEINSSHASLVSHPTAVTDLILRATHSIGL